MRRFFADTFYWVALLLRRDSWHRRVTAFSRTLTNEDVLFTTDAVLLEFLAALSAAGPHLRQQAATRVEGMLADPSMRVVEVTRALFLDGLALYQSRPDKEYRRMYSLYGVRRVFAFITPSFALGEGRRLEIPHHGPAPHAELLGNRPRRPALAVQRPDLVIGGEPPRPALGRPRLFLKRRRARWHRDSGPAIRLENGCTAERVRSRL